MILYPNRWVFSREKTGRGPICTNIKTYCKKKTHNINYKCIFVVFCTSSWFALVKFGYRDRVTWLALDATTEKRLVFMVNLQPGSNWALLLKTIVVGRKLLSMFCFPDLQPIRDFCLLRVHWLFCYFGNISYPAKKTHFGDHETCGSRCSLIFPHIIVWGFCF